MIAIPIWLFVLLIVASVPTALLILAIIANLILMAVEAITMRA